MIVFQFKSFSVQEDVPTNQKTQPESAVVQVCEVVASSDNAMPADWSLFFVTSFAPESSETAPEPSEKETQDDPVYAQESPASPEPFSHVVTDNEEDGIDGQQPFYTEDSRASSEPVDDEQATENESQMEPFLYEAENGSNDECLAETEESFTSDKTDNEMVMEMVQVANAAESSFQEKLADVSTATDGGDSTKEAVHPVDKVVSGAVKTKPLSEKALRQRVYRRKEIISYSLIMLST